MGYRMGGRDGKIQKLYELEQDISFRTHLHQSQLRLYIHDPKFREAVNVDLLEVHGVHGEGMSHIRHWHGVWYRRPRQSHRILLLIVLQDRANMISESFFTESDVFCRVIFHCEVVIDDFIRYQSAIYIEINAVTLSYKITQPRTPVNFAKTNYWIGKKVIYFLFKQ